MDPLRYSIGRSGRRGPLSAAPASKPPPEHDPAAPRAGPPATGPVAPPEREKEVPLWLRRLSLVVFVLCCLEIGLLLVVLPWTRIWTENSLLAGSPRLQVFAQQHFVRGLVSGLGLQNIHEFLTGRKERPAAISELAGKGDAPAVKTFEIFVDIYGAEAGNKALQVLARGGVFLAGGVAAKNIAHFTDGRFITAFLRKGRFSEILREFPVDVIINEQVGLLGAIDMAFRLALESHRSSIR